MSELAYYLHPSRMRAPDASSSGSSQAAETPISTSLSDGNPVIAGMQCGFKNLYAGSEDKRGRFKWIDEIPNDLGKPAEDDETAKWALIVRRVRVFNDPRRVLRIHSIVIQSPLLKDLLGNVLKGYPGVTTSLQRLTFSANFEPLIHRWTELKEAIAAEESTVTKKHAEILYNILEEELKETISEYLDLKANRVASYQLLYALFQPNGLVYSRHDGQDNALKATNNRYSKDRQGNNIFVLTCTYIDWDGARFGNRRISLTIPEFTGTLPIAQLAVYPLEMHTKFKEMKQRLIERGSRVEGFAGSFYKAYKGVGWRQNPYGAKDRYNLKGRIIIDTASWNRFNPNDAIYVSSLTQSNLPGDFLVIDSHDEDGDSSRSPGDMPFSSDLDHSIISQLSRSLSSHPEYSEFEMDSSEGMPYDGAFPEDQEGEPKKKRPSLAEEQLLICTSMVRGYSLSTKKWLNFFVNSVKEIEWNVDAFESLVLPSNQKELILGFTESQRKLKSSFDDVIEGKGRGIILLLCGPPGVGKTLTAESVAEEMRAPLYTLAAGDLGLAPTEVERNLSNILEMCTKWNAILLIDEADVFLEQRSLHELERNKLVTIFLRILEYYEGIMFLTTNRVQTLDPAFSSRIHISLDYPELAADSRLRIWRNFLKMVPNGIEERQMQRLALMEMNGRQIKNAIKTGLLLSSRKEERLGFEHLRVVLDVTQHLHKSTQETNRQRSALYG